MAVKIDKEVLIKHHFWILTGLCVLLVLIPLSCLVGSVSGTVEKEGQALDNKKKEGQGVVNSVPPNQKWVDAFKKQDVVVEKKQSEVWGQAYETQKDLITWPEELLVEYPAFKTKQFGDPVTQYEASKFAEYYKFQVPAVLKSVQPLIPGAYFRTDNSVLPNPDDDQIVQFKANNWNGVLQLLREFKRDGPPSREDVWLAQEDLWVKRELLAVIRAANDAIAHFREVTPGQPPQPQPAPAGDAKVAKDAKDAKSAKPVPKPPPAPASDPNHKVFRNYFWEMELTLSRGPKQTYLLSGKLTNIGKRRQPLGVFRVYLDDSPGSDPSLLPVDHEPLAVGQSVEIPKTPVDKNVNIRALFGVEQVLTWRTAPVKRIDELRIDYHASRLSRRSLVEPRWVEKAPAQEATTPGTTGMTMGGNTSDIKGGGGMTGPMGGFGRTGSQGMTRNGFQLQRYIDTNDQVRHMPVAMVVIADEDFIHEFLGAFANSRLRTQTLQYHWHHVREKIKPQSEQVAGGPGAERKGGANAGEANMGGARGGPGRGGMKEEMGGMMMGRMMTGLSGRMRGGAGGFTPGGIGLGKSMTETEDEDDAEMNLVELAVYGLASVYENPAKPQVAAAPDGQVAPK